jgi:hypothetical protein
MKSLAAFLNTDGGTLLIGVEDNGNILGLEKDLGLVGNSRDKFEQLLTKPQWLYPVSTRRVRRSSRRSARGIEAHIRWGNLIPGPGGAVAAVGEQTGARARGVSSGGRRRYSILPALPS